MNLQNRVFGSTVSIAMAVILPDAFAGTVITSNLPPNTVIANINARQDGAGTSNGDQSLWYQPFFTGGATQFVQCALPAGTYGFRVINPADAATLFPALTSAQTNEMFSAWTYNSPWITDYMVFDSAATNNNSLPQLFDGSPDPASYADAADAYNGALASGFYQKIRTGPTGRDGTVFTNSYTLADPATLVFVIPDYGLSDNNGGVSVLVTPLNSQPVIPRPTLTIIPHPGVINLQWLTNFAGYHLEESTNLTSWTAISPRVNIVNVNYYSVILSLGSGNVYYRLHNP